MGVMNDVTKRAREAASVATEMAKYWTEMARINVAIAGEQKEIDKNCLEIGKWFVNDYEGEIPEGVKDLVDAVSAGKAKIAELETGKPAKPAPAEEDDDGEDEAEAEEAPAGKPCPICGKVSDSRFCPHCGAPMGDE